MELHLPYPSKREDLRLRIRPNESCEHNSTVRVPQSVLIRPYDSYNILRSCEAPCSTVSRWGALRRLIGLSKRMINVSFQSGSFNVLPFTSLLSIVWLSSGAFLVLQKHVHVLDLLRPCGSTDSLTIELSGLMWCRYTVTKKNYVLRRHQ